MEKIFNQIKKLRKNSKASSEPGGAQQRAYAATLMASVISHQQTLNFSIEDLATLNPQQQSWVKEVCFGSLRFYHHLSVILNNLLNEPLAKKNADIQCLIIIGLYQIEHMNTPHHAAVNETVAATKVLKKAWAKGLCNKILRRFIKERTRLLQETNHNLQAKYSHPIWLIERLQTAWPDQWESILKENNQRPPLTLRVNLQRTTRDDYQSELASNKIAFQTDNRCQTAVTLTQSLPVSKIPKFDLGFASVQDISGQRIIELVDLKPGFQVLDACAAPGSKTCHMLEAEPRIKKLVAIDMDAKRLIKIKDNIVRLGLPIEPCRMILANACHSKEWWDGDLFDRILLDAPCSSTGVIRRHPDIKILRSPEDVVEACKQQKHLLHSLWPLLKVNGRLVYSTCSILPEENELQIKTFLKNHSDAKAIKPGLSNGIPLHYGHQCLPDSREGDGFFYCILEKQTS